MIFDNVAFKGSITLETNHHCNVGVTGVLCMPVYMFSNTTWQPNTFQMLYHKTANRYGGMFTLAPPEERAGNPDGVIFPRGFCSSASATWLYLLQLGNANASAGSLMDTVCVDADYWEDSALAKSFGYGIICNRTLRSLKVRAYARA